MSIGRAVFMRPIEILSSVDTVAFGGSAQSIAQGTYGSLLSLLYEVRLHMTAAGLSTAAATIQASTSHANYGKVTLSAASTFTVAWTDISLALELGFSGASLSGQTSYTAELRPPSMWFSRYTPSDRETWARDMKSDYAGKIARTGELCGLSTGQTIYHRTLRFDGEPGPNVFASLAVSGQDRSLESFLSDARTSVQSVATHSPTKGFYYMFSGTDMTELTAMTSGSALLWGTSASTYVFVYPEPSGLDRPSASHGTTRDWYAFDLRLHTATAPTWEQPVIPS